MANKTYNFLKTTIISIIDNDFSGMAAEMSYMLVIGIFPSLLFLISLFNLLGKNYYITPLFVFLEKFMPADTLSMIHAVLDQVLNFTSGKSVAIIGLLITLFMSMNALAVIIKGLNRAYKVEETRPFLYTRLLSLVMVIVNTLILTLRRAVFLLLYQIMDYQIKRPLLKMMSGMKLKTIWYMAMKFGALSN